jgi:hypothetical protein
MTLKPWYKVITPREDLRDGRPLDASEFAVHLDHVRDGRAPDDYKKPERFFDRTFLTSSLRELGAGVIRRLSGIKVETSAVYNLTTQFGGGKTHALTLLYHLAEAGPAASNWKGVQSLLDQAGVQNVPRTAQAVFVGTEFDSLAGRGGNDGTPLRRTPWGDIAFQLAHEEGFAVVATHDAEGIAPSTEVIRKFLPKDMPVLILMDELLNYLNRERNRKTGLGGQLYSFVQNISEEARAQDRVVLAVSLPSIVDEMTPEDEADFQRFEKLLDRLGKAMTEHAQAMLPLAPCVMGRDGRARTGKQPLPPKGDHVSRVGDVGDHPAASLRMVGIAGRREEYSYRIRRLGTGSSESHPELVPCRPREGCFHLYLSISPVAAVRIRAEVAGTPPISADPRHTSPARAVGSKRLSGRIQRRAQGPSHWHGNGTARRPAVPVGDLRATRRRKVRGRGHDRCLR